MTAVADHQTAWELIPWYVNGTLEAAERRLVERHLEGCSECRAEVELCRGLIDAGGRAEDLAPAPHPAQLDRLVERIVAEGEPPEPERLAVEADAGGGPVPSGRPPRRALSRALASGLRGPGRLAAAALVILAAGAAGYLLGPRSGPEPEAPPPAEYRTLSRPEAPSGSLPGARPAGPLLRVVFAPEAPEREIRGILLAVGGTVVDGPSSLGVYTVRLDAAPGREEPLPVVLDHMRREPRVLFVEAIEGSDSEGGESAEPPP